MHFLKRPPELELELELELDLGLELELVLEQVVVDVNRCSDRFKKRFLLVPGSKSKFNF